jgi:hypothetical protein
MGAETRRPCKMWCVQAPVRATIVICKVNSSTQTYFESVVTQ